MPSKSDISIWASPTAARIESAIVSVTSSGPPTVGVGRRSLPKTAFFGSTMTTWIFRAAEVDSCSHHDVPFRMPVERSELSKDARARNRRLSCRSCTLSVVKGINR